MIILRFRVWTSAFGPSEHHLAGAPSERGTPDRGHTHAEMTVAPLTEATHVETVLKVKADQFCDSAVGKIEQSSSGQRF